VSFPISLLAIIIAALCIATLGNINIIYLNAYGQEGGTISIKTDNPTYFPGDTIRVFGSLYNKNGSPVTNASIHIDAYQSKDPNEPKKIIYRTSIITDSNGKYSDDGLRISESDYGLVSSMMNFSKMSPNLFGESYIVEASTSFGGIMNSTWTKVEIKNMFLTFSSLALLSGLIWVFGFIAAVWWPIKIEFDKDNIPWSKRAINILKAGPQSKQIIVFVCISGMVLAPIASLLLADIEVGKHSPLGFVKKEFTSVNGSITNQWVMNFGGTEANNFSSGVQVPIYILIFGIAGGYIRYLYDKWYIPQKQSKAPVITQPANNAEITTPTVDITGTGEPSASVIVFDIDNPLGVSNVKPDGTWILTSPKLLDGKHVFKAKSTDEEGKSSPYSKMVIFSVNHQPANLPNNNPKGTSSSNVLMEMEQNNRKKEKEAVKENMKLFIQSLHEIALIVISPLLAIAIWFVLFQGGTTSDYTLAAIGITTGFLIREIVNRLIGFATPNVTAQSAQ
jgi:hypothetical protein